MVLSIYFKQLKVDADDDSSRTIKITMNMEQIQMEKNLSRNDYSLGI